MQYLHAIMPMLRQIERVVQKGPITNNGFLPVTTLVF